MDYINLIKQKKELARKLSNLDAIQFGATSWEEMNTISEERINIKNALQQIEKQLNPQP